MCECLEYDDGARFQCPVCADMDQAKDARIAELESIVQALIRQAMRREAPEDE